jgi:hypothetical protein
VSVSEPDNHEVRTGDVGAGDRLRLRPRFAVDDERRGGSRRIMLEPLLPPWCTMHVGAGMERY